MISGKLLEYIEDFDRQAEGITEQLKTDNQMEWVRRMNLIRNRVEEVVTEELIYS